MGEQDRKECLYTCPNCHSSFSTKLECEDHMRSCTRQKVWKINLEREIQHLHGKIEWHVHVFHQEENSPFHFNEIHDEGASVNDDFSTLDSYMTVEKLTDVQAGIDRLKLHAIDLLMQEIESVKNAKVFPPLDDEKEK
jgi:hypothetical protein